MPAGYLRDYGQAFGARSSADQGSGLSYGWLTEAGRQPLDLSVGGTTNVGNGRDRNLETDQRLDTFMHMQAEDVPSFNGTVVNGLWEIAVPDGQYAVTVAVGDGAANADPENHRINVEGANAIAGFVPTGGAGSATHHTTATVTVSVADGRLTRRRARRHQHQARLRGHRGGRLGDRGSRRRGRAWPAPGGSRPAR